MDERTFSLNIGIHRVGESYQVELSHLDPTSEAQVAPLRGGARFDRVALRSLQATHADYGKALSAQLFAEDELGQRFVQVETAAQATDSYLRVSLSIDPSAQELQSLRWELLRHPKTGAPLTTSEKLLLSRFMVSRDWRPVRLRARTELEALVAVSAPTPTKLAPVDFEGEVGRMKAALEGVALRTLGGPRDPLTLDRLVESLREGVDILYLVSHGMFGRTSGTPALILQDDTGKANAVTGEALAERIAELRQGPRLVVLASCQSAGDGNQVETSQRSSVQATLAARLADAGVPAVLAMQGHISMKTIEQMMPVFFRELVRDGQIDRALAIARAKVRGRDDAWMPALFTRLKAGRIWYTPGFAGDQDEVWRKVLKPVKKGKIVPILGPRLLEAVYGSSHDTALHLAEVKRFPLAPHQRDDLPRVTEFMSVMEARNNLLDDHSDQLLGDLIAQHRHWLPADALARPRLGKLLARVGDHLREHSPSDVHKILAALPAALYVTTNFDPLLERALAANERPPQQVSTRWRYEDTPISADDQVVTTPSADAPMVYHVFGAFGGDDDNLVLTEDDHFDYLMKASATRLMPTYVEKALVNNSLLFLGFRLTDWHFRLLFRLMMSLGGRDKIRRSYHVAVQIDPDMQSMADIEGAKAYLAKYFADEANIAVFWGSSEEFLTALHRELEASGEPDEAEAPEQENDDEWTF